MQTYKIKIISNQSCFTVIKTSGCCNQAVRCHNNTWYWMYYKIQWYTICMLIIWISGIVVFIILNVRRLKLLRGHLFSNTVKIILFMSDAQYYILVKLCRTAGSIHLFKITGKLVPEHIKLKKNISWNVIEIDLKEVNMTLMGNKINLPLSVTIPLRDKFKIGHIIKWEPMLFHVLLKQGMTWLPLVTNDSLEKV